MKNRMLILLVCVVMLCGCTKKENNKSEKLIEGSSGNEFTTDAYWADDAIIYQLFVRSFYDSDGNGIGDFNGVAQKIDYFKELGINTIWLMPIMKSNSIDGYDVVDYYKVDSDYGTEEDFTNLINTLHENNMHVLIDFNANYTASSNEWFKEALSNPSSKYAEYYHFYDEEPEEDDENYFYSELAKKWYWGHYGLNFPNLNYSSAVLRNEMKEVAKYWIELGVDGFVADHCKRYDKNEEVIYDWFKEFTKYVNEINSDIFVMGNVTVYSDEKIAPYLGGMNAILELKYRQSICGTLNGTVKDYISELNTSDTTYRIYSEAIDSVNEHPNHGIVLGGSDYIRIASNVTDEGDSAEISIAKTKLAAAIQMTSLGIPIIYYGEEIGMKADKYAGDLNYLKEPMDWNKIGMGEGIVKIDKALGIKAQYSFPSDGISVEEQKEDENSILSYYKKLVKIRNDNAILKNGTYKTIGICNNMLAYTISSENEEYSILVVHNEGVTEDGLSICVDGENLLNDTNIKENSVITLEPYATFIFRYTGSELPISRDSFIDNYSEYSKVKIVANLPENTPENQSIYFTGTINDWNECDEGYIMTRTSPTTCEITLDLGGITSVEYKITRGSWNNREQNAKGEDLIGEEQQSNRTYTYSPDKSEIHITVEKWMDL